MGSRHMQVSVLAPPTQPGREGTRFNTRRALCQPAVVDRSTAGIAATAALVTMYRGLGSLVSLCGLQCAGPLLLYYS
jgi:hypothetical protein